MKTATTPVCFLCTAEAAPEPFLAHGFPSLLEEQDAASPTQAQRRQSKQLPLKKPSSSTYCLLTLYKLQKHCETEEQTRKAGLSQMAETEMVFSC